MNEHMFLAKDDKIGYVNRCIHGVVHINCRGVSVHFTEAAFLKFASMIKEAFSRLLDLHLSDFIDKEKEEEL